MGSDVVPESVGSDRVPAGEAVGSDGVPEASSRTLGHGGMEPQNRNRTFKNKGRRNLS